MVIPSEARDLLLWMNGCTTFTCWQAARVCSTHQEDLGNVCERYKYAAILIGKRDLRIR
jgi:hypothetical protein